MNIKDSQTKPVFPFSAIIGQEEMKLTLCLNVIDPKIGGVMIMGDRGTGKSTTIRALTDILPKIKIIKNDPYNTNPESIDTKDIEITEIKTPMIDLPLGATEDRVCGTIDLEQAIKEGVKAFEPGLLAKANRGILYVDEINLLDDHLVDILLDSAASGWNIVEREGISITHPARFILIGSGNPEEGELRPQLLDRFGLHAEIRTVKDPNLRVQIVNERIAFDESPQEWLEKHKENQDSLKQRLIEAKKNINNIFIPQDLRIKISKICSELNVDGLRGDLVCNRAAIALASFEGDSEVNITHIKKIIKLCLRHRLKKDPMETIDSGKKIEDTFESVFELCY